jgi:hypothetical protein
MQLCRAIQLRLWQKMMATMLVNQYLAFKYLTDKEMTLREFTNSFTLAMCATVVEGSDSAVAVSMCS